MSRFPAVLRLSSRRGTPLFTFEVVAVLYFGVLSALSPLTGAVRRWPPVGAAAAIFAGAIVALSRVLGADARVWLGHLYLIAGYWLPALLVERSPHRFEAWLQRSEPFESFGSFGSFGSFRLFGWFREIGELAYLCCYPLVPAAFIVIYMTGSIEEVSRYWTSVFIAGFACYVSLPWLVSRPPRVIERGAEDRVAQASRVRRLNIRVLEHLSHGWNTFPSGHVAVAFAGALSMMTVAPRAGVGFLIVATGIAIGSVSGRYHYAVDAFAGSVIGVGAWAVSVLLRP